MPRTTLNRRPMSQGKGYNVGGNTAYTTSTQAKQYIDETANSNRIARKAPTSHPNHPDKVFTPSTPRNQRPRVTTPKGVTKVTTSSGKPVMNSISDLMGYWLTANKIRHNQRQLKARRGIK